jgi:hypothetical protein
MHTKDVPFIQIFRLSEANTFGDSFYSASDSSSWDPKQSATFPSVMFLLDIRNYWVFGLCPSSGIKKTREQRFGNWICFSPLVWGRDLLCWGPLGRANLNHRTSSKLRLAFSSHLSPEDRNIQFPERCVL